MRREQQDAYLRRFETTVTDLHERSGETWLRLDASAFYPTSGGQPHDTGTIVESGADADRRAEVVDVRIIDGAVWHKVTGTPPAVGAAVTCALDWDRRYRHMQRHTAQHLLSQAFVRLDPAFATRSVSLRGPDCTLDLGGEPGPGDLDRAQRLVNDFGYRDLPIASFEVDESEVAAYDLRRAPKVHGRVRLVRMGDVELAACGGTHLARTGEALPIVLLGSERVRGGSLRVTFRAGWEALERLSADHAIVDGLVAALSAPADGLQEAVDRLRSELSSTRTEATRARAAHADAVAQRLLAELNGPPGTPLLAVVEDALLEPLADALRARPEAVALLGSSAPGRARVSFVRSAGSDIDLRPALRAALEVLEGRGGGRPERAQGGGPRVERLDDALAAAREALARSGRDGPGAGQP